MKILSLQIGNKLMNNILDPEEVDRLIQIHIQDYIKFMDEILALEIMTGITRYEAYIKVGKNYPHFMVN